MSQNYFEQLKMSKKFEGLTAPPKPSPLGIWLTLRASRSRSGISLSLLTCLLITQVRVPLEKPCKSKKRGRPKQSEKYPPLKMRINRQDVPLMDFSSGKMDCIVVIIVLLTLSYNITYVIFCCS